MCPARRPWDHGKAPRCHRTSGSRRRCCCCSRCCRWCDVPAVEQAGCITSQARACTLTTVCAVGRTHQTMQLRLCAVFEGAQPGSREYIARSWRCCAGQRALRPGVRPMGPSPAGGLPLPACPHWSPSYVTRSAVTMEVVQPPRPSSPISRRQPPGYCYLQLRKGRRRNAGLHVGVGRPQMRSTPRAAHGRSSSGHCWGASACCMVWAIMQRGRCLGSSEAGRTGPIPRPAALLHSVRAGEVTVRCNDRCGAHFFALSGAFGARWEPGICV